MADDEPIKRCFVTVGATASFGGLIKAVLQPAFLETLLKHGYNDLRIQYGKDSEKTFEDYRWLLDDDIKERIIITGFDFDQNGLGEEMLATKRSYKGSPHQGQVGCVISHAGSGSILDALRIDLPTIVVPNTELLHNHQLELAEVLAEQNYVVHGDLKALSEAIPKVEALKQSMKQWPPIAGSNEKTPKMALQNILDDELGFD